MLQAHLTMSPAPPGPAVMVAFQEDDKCQNGGIEGAAGQGPLMLGPEPVEADPVLFDGCLPAFWGRKSSAGR